MKNTSFKLSLIAATVAVASGCASMQDQSSPLAALKETFASDDPCSNNARNVAMVAGVVISQLLVSANGKASDRDRLAALVVGGTVGALIGADIDKKRCELSKIAKAYDLEIKYAVIEEQGDVKPVVGSERTEVGQSADTVRSVAIGHTVTVLDKDGQSGHFEPGSDQLTPRAREYFSAIAEQYAPSAQQNDGLAKDRNDQASKQLAVRKILLIGHTDDSGSSQANASLSEARAKAVAGYLKAKGVQEANIFYQGAGETLPVADNRTEAGQAANRRVEIVEMADEKGLQKYFEKRKPNYSFYRPQARGANLDENPASVAPSSQQAPAPALLNRNSKPNTASQPPVINYGGTPYTPAIARLDVGTLLTEKNAGLISKAQADDSVLLYDCSNDRPRISGSVKSLRDGRRYKTSEHLPQLYGKTWASDVNGNLLVINNLAVLRDGGAPANSPELKVYAQYKPGVSKRPEVSEEPAVNSYLVDKGVLYRMFTRGDGGLRCVDLLFALDGSTRAQAGKLIYVTNGSRFVTDFRPQMQ